MLFNEKLLFLHVPKTGGTSVTSFLIRNLPGQLVLTEPADLPARSDRVPVFARAGIYLRQWRRRLGLLRRRGLRRVQGVRHETLAEARESLTALGRRLEDFEAILAILRNPYDLEVSRFHFFRHGHLGIRGLAHEKAEEIAMSGDFAAFARDAPYHGQLPGRIEEWFELEGRSPANLQMLRFEFLEADLHRAITPFGATCAPLPHLNASAHAPYKDYLTRDIEEAIYLKYRWAFDRGYYRRDAV